VKLSKNGLQKIDQFMTEDRHLMCAFIFFPMMRHFGRLKTIGKDAGTSTHIFHIAAANPNQIIVRSGTLRQPPCHTAPLHLRDASDRTGDTLSMCSTRTLSIQVMVGFIDFLFFFLPLLLDRAILHDAAGNCEQGKSGNG